MQTAGCRDQDANPCIGELIAQLGKGCREPNKEGERVHEKLRVVDSTDHDANCAMTGDTARVRKGHQGRRVQRGGVERKGRVRGSIDHDADLRIDSTRLKSGW